MVAILQLKASKLIVYFVSFTVVIFIILNIIFRLFRPKISLNLLKTLRKHLFSLQIDEKNNIFLDFIAKNCFTHNIRYELSSYVMMIPICLIVVMYGKEVETHLQ